MMGTLLWQIFVDAINCPIGALGSARAMLTKINFPREAILVAGIYMLAFNFLIRLLLVFAVMIVWKIPVDAGLFFFPVASVSLFLTGFSIGLLLAPIAFLYSDIGQGLSIITRFWMLLTPVVYPPQTSGLAGLLTKWNPISPPHHHRPRMPHRPRAYAFAGLLGRHGLRYHCSLHRPRPLPYRHAAFDSVHGRVALDQREKVCIFHTNESHPHRTPP